jgi:hypothetical protein
MALRVITRRNNKAIIKQRSKVDNFGTIEERQQVSTALFQANKFSDEYYTLPATWEEWIDAHHPIKDTRTYIEPFAGDGTGLRSISENGVKVEWSGYADFWEWVKSKPDPKKTYVLTNPPYSFKWLVVNTLMEMGISFTMVLPWQMFFASGEGRLAQYIQQFGGCFKIQAIKKNKFKRPDGTFKRVGVFFLNWEK